MSAPGPTSSLPEPLAQWLEPLGEFIDAPSIHALNAGGCEPEALPQPYQRLLAHQRDMTSTLESYHGVILRVDARKTRRHGTLYSREVTLRCAIHRRAVEFGIIRIHIDRLDATGQKLALDGKVPFGAILNGLKIPYVSRPSGYFWLDSIPEIEGALDDSILKSLLSLRRFAA